MQGKSLRLFLVLNLLHRMSNLNAHIKKSHGLTWKEAEVKYGISAKTGLLLNGEESKSPDEHHSGLM